MPAPVPFDRTFQDVVIDDGHGHRKVWFRTVHAGVGTVLELVASSSRSLKSDRIPLFSF